MNNLEVDKKREEWLAKKRKQQAMNFQINMVSMMQKRMKEEPALLNIIERVVTEGRMPALLKLQQMTASYIQIVNSGSVE